MAGSVWCRKVETDCLGEQFADWPTEPCRHLTCPPAPCTSASTPAAELGPAAPPLCRLLPRLSSLLFALGLVILHHQMVFPTADIEKLQARMKRATRMLSSF